MAKPYQQEQHGRWYLWGMLAIIFMIVVADLVVSSVALKKAGERNSPSETIYVPYDALPDTTVSGGQSTEATTNEDEVDSVVQTTRSRSAVSRSAASLTISTATSAALANAAASALLAALYEFVSPGYVVPPTYGPHGTKVQFLVYIDFQCPGTGQFINSVFPELLSYLQTAPFASVVVRPIRMVDYQKVPFLGTESLLLANGAYCANDVGSFDVYMRKIAAVQTQTTNSGHWTVATIVSTVGTIPNSAQFQACLASGYYNMVVMNETAFASSFLDITSVPGVVVQGHGWGGLSYHYQQGFFENTVPFLIQVAGDLVNSTGVEEPPTTTATTAIVQRYCRPIGIEYLVAGGRA